MVPKRGVKGFRLALVCLLFGIGTALGQAPTFSKIVLFGDSLSDTGNVRNRTNAKSSGAVDYPSHTFNYDNGRFTNDDQTDPGSATYVGVWHEQLARTFLGLSPATFSLGGGLTYSFGGAMTTDGTHDETAVETPFGDIVITVDDMGKQMDDYFASHVIDPAALYIVWGGANDLRNDDSASNVTATAARTTALVSRLANAGAQYIMAPNLPPVGNVPRYADDPVRIATLNRDSANYRTELDADLTALQSTLAAQNINPTIYRVDMWLDSVRVFANGPRFGFTNITSPAQDNSSADPDQYVFWDDKHPTTAGHFRLAKTAFDAMTNPSPAPSKAVNISTRAFVDTGERVTIAGFIVTGDISKKVLIRGIGPSLTSSGVPTPLADPTLTLFDSAGTVQTTNDDWKNSPDVADIMATGIAPTDDHESAILVTLPPGQYTAQLAGKDDTIGNGVVEVYDLASSTSATLANISTRGYVGAGDDAMIGGVIIASGDTPLIVFRALGPSLAAFGVANPLLDPTLELYDDNGNLVVFTDDWQDPQRQAVQAVNLAPSNPKESAFVAAFLSPGNYTTVIRGKNNTTGVATVEVYRVP
jgi:phospholipase/lecithinase/hemolysin